METLTPVMWAYLFATYTEQPSAAARKGTRDALVRRGLLSSTESGWRSLTPRGRHLIERVLLESRTW